MVPEAVIRFDVFFKKYLTFTYIVSRMFQALFRGCLIFNVKKQP